MRKYLLTLAVLLCAGVVIAELEVVTLRCENVQTTGEIVATKKGITGKIVAFSINNTMGMVCHLGTEAGYGLSPKAAQVVHTNGLVIYTFQTNMTETVYLANDRLRFACGLAQTNGYAGQANVLLER
jgi:proteasome assembly chaperone (PAC2) family protein